MAKVERILSYLDELYPEPICALDFSSPYELLVAVVLSAQCTDKRVNTVTSELFRLANTPEKMIMLGQDRLKEIIYPCGFYNSKSKAIIDLSNDLVERFDSIVPNNITDLMSLKGVGRKTANVVLGVIFNKQTIAVDTHVHRISNRLGLSKTNSTPYECEKSLTKLIPKSRHTKFHHQMIWFGRDICSSRNPKCSECKLINDCIYNKKKR